MFAVQLVELGVIRGAVLGAVPPAPVTAFGGQDGFVGVGEGLARGSGRFAGGVGFAGGRTAVRLRALSGALIGVARVSEKIPGANIFAVADPHVEIRADPRGG